MDTFTALAAGLAIDDPLDLTTADPATATLADLQARSGLTKVAIAAQLDMTPGAWDAIERGRQPLRPGTARRVADLLEVDPETIQAAHRGAWTQPPAVSATRTNLGDALRIGNRAPPRRAPRAVAGPVHRP